MSGRRPAGEAATALGELDALASPRRAVGPAGTRVAHTRGHSQREVSGSKQFSAERWRVMVSGDGPPTGRHGKWWNRAPWDTGRVASRGLGVRRYGETQTVTLDQGVPGVARSGAALTWRFGSGLSKAGRRRREVLVGRTALQTRHDGRGHRGRSACKAVEPTRGAHEGRKLVARLLCRSNLLIIVAGEVLTRQPLTQPLKVKKHYD